MALAADEDFMILPSGTYFRAGLRAFRDVAPADRRGQRALEDVPGRTLKINRFQAALWDELQDLGVVTAQAEAWKKSVGGLLAGDQIIDRAVPDDAAGHPAALSAERVSTGSPSCTTTNSAGCWPTTWAWARPCRPWR